MTTYFSLLLALMLLSTQVLATEPPTGVTAGVQMVQPFSGTSDTVPGSAASMTERSSAVLLANAERIDQQNRDLLIQRQKQLIQIEQLQTQVAVLENDRSNEGIREGAVAVFIGVILGWFLGRNRRNTW